MPSSRAKDLSLSVLVAAIVAAAGLVPLGYYYGNAKRAEMAQETGVAVPAPAPAPGQPAETVAPPPPGTEVVPPEEAETDRGPTSATPAGPTLSYARAAGLHLKPDPLRLNSSVALVVDQDSGQVLAQKNEDAVLPIASLTKIMTALVVLEARQPMNEVLTITAEDVDTERNSRSRLRVGTTLTREEALHLALMSSENRAAHALGRAYPGGLPKLVEAMNAKAQALGMKNTSYVDPTGLSNRNQSTARDIALLVAAAGRNPVLAGFSTTPGLLANLGGRTMQYRNSNRLVRSDTSGWDIALQKTGYIVEAGRCLTMLTRVAGHNLILVLLDADSNRARMDDAQRLRRWVVAQNGWHDEVMLARAAAGERDKPRRQAVAAKASGKQAVAKGKDRKEARLAAARKKKDVQVAAARKDDKGAAAAAKRKPAGKDTAVAKKAEPDAKREGRVKQTFAAGRDDPKS